MLVAVFLVLLLSLSIALSSAELDMEWIYYDVLYSLPEPVQDLAWIVEPPDEWNLTEREQYIFQIALLEGYEWGYEDCLYRPQD